MALVGNSDVTEDKFKELIQGGVEDAYINSAGPYAKTMSCNGTAAPLATTSSVLKVGAFLQNLSSTTDNITVYIGDSSVTAGGVGVKYTLKADKVVPINAGEDLADIYVISSSPTTVTYRGT